MFDHESAEFDSALDQEVDEGEEVVHSGSGRLAATKEATYPSAGLASSALGVAR